MKPITDKQVEDLINIKFKPIFDKFNDISKNIDSKNNFLELIDKAISFEIDARKEIKFLDTAELGNILYSFIFEQNSSLKEMTQPEMITGIINESLYSSHEHLMSDEIFVASIARWLKYHVIPYIYEHKEEYEAEDKEIILKYSSEIAEERNNGGTLEHRHESNMYWHPVTRVHTHRITKDKLPQGHILNNKLPLGHITKEKTEEQKSQRKDIVDEQWSKINKALIDVSISNALDNLNFVTLTDNIYNLIFIKNLNETDISLNPIHINILIDNSLFESKKEISSEVIKETELWLRKTAIPNVFNELGIQQKSPETIISEGFSEIPEKDEVITKSQITACIFPLNLNYISKENFDIYIRDKGIIDVIYTYINDNKYIQIQNAIDPANDIYKKLHIDPEPPIEIVGSIRRWLDRAVIPCIVKTIEKEKPKDEYVTEIKQIDFTIKEDSPLYKRMNIIVRNFYDSFYTHDSLCLYYTYYILKLKGNTDFDLEFRELEDKLYRDFYNYGIFAIIRELRHFIGVFHYTYKFPNHNEIEIGDYIPYNFTTKQQTKFKSGFKKVVTDIAKCVKIDVKDIYKIINIDEIDKNTKLRYNNRNIDDKENLIIRDTEFLYLIEKYFGYYTRPEFILKVAVKAFSITKENLSTCRWSESYGGEAWGTIARTILHRKDTTSKTIFVDTCWSLQHNTSLFINKVYSQDGSQNDNSLSKVKRYLTEIKDGLFKNVYACAIKHNTKLDRFIYRTLILDNDASVSDAKYHEPEHEREPRQDREPESYFEKRERLPEKERRRRTSLEKEDINIVQYNDEDKIKVYKEIDDSFGLIKAKINKLESGWNDNPNVEIIINSASFRWITDLESITNYMNRNHPFFNIRTETIKSLTSEKQSKETSIIENIILDNINNLTNSEMKNIIHSTINYQALANILQRWIYQSDYTTIYLKENVGALISNSLIYEVDFEDKEKLKLLKIWIFHYLISDLLKGTSLKLGGLDTLFN